MGESAEHSTGTDSDGTTPRLTVSFLDDIRTIEAPGRLSFGRSADLIVDDNPSLHRIVGVFFWYDGLWYLGNQSTSTALQLVDNDSSSSMRIAPGASASLGFRSGTMKFAVGNANYALELETTRSHPTLTPPIPATDQSDATRQPSALPLTPEQRILVVALAEPSLRQGSLAPLPTNRSVARHLGWSATKFNRKLDAVCLKLSEGGVVGLTGSVDRLARDRRQRLVEYAIDAGLVTPHDLALLDAYAR